MAGKVIGIGACRFKGCNADVVFKEDKNGVVYFQCDGAVSATACGNRARLSLQQGHDARQNLKKKPKERVETDGIHRSEPGTGGDAGNPEPQSENKSGGIFDRIFE